jgi:hypothetical protein
LSPWIPISENTLDATTAIALIENDLGTRQDMSVGSLKYQYALNNGALNGVWLTFAQLLAAMIGQAITNHTNSLQLKVQFISDGTQHVDITGFGSYAQASGISSGGGK